MRPQRTERILKECKTRVTNEEVQAFYACQHTRNACTLFMDIQNNPVLTEREIADARDYLLTIITLRTGTRPGALQHMTLTQYKAMKKDSQRGHYVVLVSEHKRQIDGPAVITLTEDLKNLMDIYINKICPQLSRPSADHIFLNNSGEPQVQQVQCSSRPPRHCH